MLSPALASQTVEHARAKAAQHAAGHRSTWPQMIRDVETICNNCRLSFVWSFSVLQVF